MIKKDYDDLVVECEKDGQKAISNHASSANGAMWGNILLGGGIGALVDSGRGAGFDYPTNIRNPLNCSPIKDNNKHL